MLFTITFEPLTITSTASYCTKCRPTLTLQQRHEPTTGKSMEKQRKCRSPSLLNRWPPTRRQTLAQGFRAHYLCNKNINRRQ